jgi:hypothetical protein
MEQQRNVFCETCRYVGQTGDGRWCCQHPKTPHPASEEPVTWDACKDKRYPWVDEFFWNIGDLPWDWVAAGAVTLVLVALVLLAKC